MHFEHKFEKLGTDLLLGTCLLLSTITGYICDSSEKMYILHLCTYYLLNTCLLLYFNTFVNFKQLCVLHSIHFSLSDNRNSSVPRKVKKASSAATKRSIADSEEKSEAYKSIFTSHSSAKRPKDKCSNWVTHTAYCFWNNEEPDSSIHYCFPSL